MTHQVAFSKQSSSCKVLTTLAPDLHSGYDWEVSLEIDQESRVQYLEINDERCGCLGKDTIPTNMLCVGVMQ